MAWEAPRLSLTKTDSALEKELRSLTLKRQIIDRLINGESALSISQDESLKLSERDVRAMLKEAMELQDETFRKEASTLQQLHYSRHEMMYQRAAKLAFFTVEKDGETIEKSDINWVREMRASLIEMQKILAPHLLQLGEEKVKEIRVTITTDDQLYQKAEGIKHLADVKIEDVIQGRLLNDGS